MGLCELPPNMMRFRRAACATVMGYEFSDEENDGLNVNELEWENLANIGGDDDGDSDDDDDDDDSHEQFMVSLDGGVGGISFHTPFLACETSIQQRGQSGK
ncbi:hypothetical protein VNO77_41918 [Canavalia gladiata]|uniref:Uncharacterized protein n=1 Tax=Canavalia gladiata TaxID=3824 RepID=A0AAN9PRY7_CANGL